LILETTFAIDFLRGKPEAIALRARLQEEEQLLLAAPTVMELWDGATRRGGSREKNAVGLFTASVEILPLDSASAKTAGEVIANAARKGIVISPTDAMIAAIALTKNETLVTRDSDYSKIPGLKLLKY
jgi:predicted nucleic acid-binding protein